MKLNKFLAVGCVAGLISMAPSVFAATPESNDYESTNAACTIAVNDTSAIRFINVNHIRLIQIKNESHKSNDDDKNGKTLNISLTGGKNVGYYDTNLTIGYRSKADAIKAMNELSDKINDCQYDAAEKRAARKKKQ
jgi:uncharacterized heparinase superfamily protein